MPKRRGGTLEILYAMVEVCRKEKGAIKTHIQYQTNQAHAGLEKNLDILKKIGWIEETKRNERAFYVVTDSGVRAVKGYKTVFNEIPEEHRHLILAEITREFFP